MSRITPDYAPHVTLEREVNELLESLGYYHAAATYHEVLSAELQSRLKVVYSLASIYIRTRADCIAIHKSLPLVFELDAKTHKSQRYRDITVELIPFLHHIYKSSLGVPCLYCYWNPVHEQTCGFWFADLPMVREVRITSRCERFRSRLTKACDELLPGVPLIPQRSTTDGSDDAFLVIDGKTVDRLPSWRDLINDYTEDARVVFE